MADKRANFTQLMLAESEQIISMKANDFMTFVDYVRLANGPYSVRLYAQQTATRVQVEMLEDYTDIGGLYSDGSNYMYSRRKFTVFYETRVDNEDTYARWDNVQFKSYQTTGTFYGVLTSGTNVYENEADISNVDSDAFYCISSTGYQIDA